MGTVPKVGFGPAYFENHPVKNAAIRAGLAPSLVVQRRQGWSKVIEEGRCRACERPSSVRPLTRHHLVPLSWFRNHPRFAPLRHADANIVPLCRPCHDLVEQDAGARRMLRRLLGGAEAGFAVGLRGQQWLDGIYPR